MDKLNKPISTEETESMINNFPKQKAPGSDGFIGEFNQTFKEEIMPLLYNYFQKTEAEGILFNSFCEASITLLPKPMNNYSNIVGYKFIIQKPVAFLYTSNRQIEFEIKNTFASFLP